MRERMYDMMRILVDESLNGANVLFDDHELTVMLEHRGFLPDEIYEALSWLHNMQGDSNEYNESIFDNKRGKSVRVLHPEERLAFTPAAHGVIHKLCTQGVINDILREEIIQRCIDLASNEIGLEEVKTVTLLIFLKKRRDSLSNSLIEVLGIEGNRPSS